MHTVFRHGLFLIVLLCSSFVVHSQITVNSQISASADDAEERLSTGAVSLTSTDIEIIRDGGTDQLIGLRFQNISIPQGSTILSASIQFTVDEIDSSAASATIHGEDVDNSVQFVTTTDNISNRTLTTASINWNSIPPWNTVGLAGPDQETPDLTSIVQEIVNRGGWYPGNAISFIFSGLGERTAVSYNGDASQAAVLTITANVTSDPLPTIVSNPNKGLPFIYFMADNRSELYAVAPDSTATPLPSPTVVNTTFGGNPISFTGEGGGFRSTDRLVYVFQGNSTPPSDSSDLYAIDPTTGVATLIQSDIVQGHVDGAEFWLNNATGEEVLLILYQNGRNGGPDRIMAVNPNASGSNPAWSPYTGFPITLNGALTQSDGISWNPDQNEFYVQNDDNVDYFTVDINTGTTNLAFATSLAVDGEGITYASDGTNYIEDEGQAGLGRIIYIVDPSTGNLTPAAELGGDGDVESIMGNLGTRNDAGDAPSTYGYAAHLLPVLTSTPITTYLGSIAPDSENPFLNFSSGSGDDILGDDEDGVTSGGIDFNGQLLTLGQTRSIDIVTNGAGVLNAWLDFNRDGDFDDSGEQIATDVSPVAGSINLNIPIPLTATAGISYARFRFSTESGIASGNSEVSDGEVEDYQVILHDPTSCAPGTTLVETNSTIGVNAVTVILDQSVGSQNNALGNNNATLAVFNNNNDELILEMGELIGLGDETTVNGPNGNQFDVWISSSATGPWTQVGNNAVLDFTFTSPIDWLYIRLRKAAGGNQRISFIEGRKTVIVSSCEPDNDGDTIPDTVDLDDDNDGILDTVERPKTVLWVTQGTPAPEEQNTIDKLITLGYTVTVVEDNVGGNADDYSVTFIYEDANSGTAYANVSNLNTTTNGVVTTENALFDEILGTSGSTASSNTNLINITDNTHPITLGLPIGNYDVGDASFYVNNVVSGQKLGNHPNGQAVLIAWEVGDALDTGIAPGRRSVLSLGNSNGGFNENGEDLLVNAIIWAAGLDTDGDGITDDLDLDSDNDGCNDAVEAYSTLNADLDGNGYYGTGNPPAINLDGTVAAAAYSVPADVDSNSTFDFQEAGIAPSISTQPMDLRICPGCDGSFSAIVSNADGYQWQLFNGSIWVDLTDIGIHSGTTTPTLNITNAAPSDNGNQYRLRVTNSLYICSDAISDTAVLTVNVTSVITNRRITYRVRKN